MPSSDEDGDSRSAAEEAFQWPPPTSTVREPLRFAEHVAAPVPEVTPDLDEAPPPPVRPPTGPAKRAASDFEDESSGAFERAPISPAAPVERAMVSPPAERPRPPFELPSFTGTPAEPAPAAWLTSHASLVGFGLVGLLALGEGLYILRLGRPAATSPAATSGLASTAAASATPPPSPASVPRPAVDPATGHLIIRSEPSGAAVSIDGVPFGVTPVTLAAAPVGEWRIVLKLDGREVEQTVRVEPGATATVIAPMAPAPAATSSSSGWVSITSGAELDILENGVLVGSTRSPKVMMPAGTHTLQLVNAALGVDASRQVRVDAGKVAKLNLVLPDGAIHLNAQPWAEVWIDGKAAGETPIANLPLGIGTHQIVFRHPELGEKTVSTVVKAGAPTRVTVDLRK